MATIKISGLTAAAAATGTQELEVNESGTSKKITGSQLLSYIEGEISSSPTFTGQVSVADGSVSAPSITNTGDTNTGIFFPAEDTIAFAEGGAEAMRIDSSGRVGIGTSSPNNPLVVSNGGAAGIELVPADSNGPSLYYYNRATSSWATAVSFANQHIWNVAGTTEAMRLDSSGNVGIGTSSPSSILNVSAASPTITLTATTTTGTTLGNKNNRLVLLSDSVTVGAGGEVVFAAGDSSTDRWGVISGAIQARSGSGSYGDIIFGTKATDTATTLSERIRITSAGDVGIGTATPPQRFTAANASIAGGAPASSGSSADPNAVTRFQAGAVVMDFGVYSAGQMWIQNRAASNYATNYDLVLNPNGANVGIAKIPSSSFKLDVNGAISDSKGDVRVIVVNSQTTGYTLVAGDSGKFISITTGGVTIPSGVFSAGDAISIYNNSANNQTITQGGSVTMYLGGTATTGNRTLAQRGLCTVLCVASNTFVISGAGLT